MQVKKKGKKKEHPPKSPCNFPVNENTVCCGSRRVVNVLPPPPRAGCRNFSGVPSFCKQVTPSPQAHMHTITFRKLTAHSRRQVKRRFGSPSPRPPHPPALSLPPPLLGPLLISLTPKDKESHRTMGHHLSPREQLLETFHCQKIFKPILPSTSLSLSSSSLCISFLSRRCRHRRRRHLLFPPFLLRCLFAWLPVSSVAGQTPISPEPILID